MFLKYEGNLRDMHATQVAYLFSTPGFAISRKELEF
jgi:hypothetical protein